MWNDPFLEYNKPGKIQHQICDINVEHIVSVQWYEDRCNFSMKDAKGDCLCWMKTAIEEKIKVNRQLTSRSLSLNFLKNFIFTCSQNCVHETSVKKKKIVSKKSGSKILWKNTEWNRKQMHWPFFLTQCSAKVATSWGF